MEKDVIMKGSLLFPVDIVNKTKPCQFKYVPPYSDGKIHFGYIAQDLQDVFPYGQYAVVGMKNGFFTVDKTQMIPFLHKNIQILNEQVAELKKELEELKDAKVRTGNK